MVSPILTVKLHTIHVCLFGKISLISTTRLFLLVLSKLILAEADAVQDGMKVSHNNRMALVFLFPFILSRTGVPSTLFFYIIPSSFYAYTFRQKT